MMLRFTITVFLLALAVSGRLSAAQSVALYDAGVAGNPAAARSPASAALPWTAGMPTSDTGNFQSAAVSPDGTSGFNAWRMLDNSTAASQFITWTRPLTTQQHTDAAAYGWIMTTRLRVADPVAANGGANSTVLLYGNNSTGGPAKRWILFFDLNAAGEIMTTLVGASGNTTVTLTGVDATQYHVHELRYSPTTTQAEYFVDGILKSSGYTGTGTNFNGVQWGTGSSGGRGDGYWNAVEFLINDPPAPPAPAVTSHPVSQSVTAGANVSLTSTFSGTGLSFQWYKNAAPIAGATSATLTLNNVSAGDAGDYWTRATNASGTAETRTAALEIRSGASLVLSEFVAENDHGLIDTDGEQHDWLELHNPTTATLSTTGLFLTDDALVPGKWALPAVNIAPGGFLTVFASEKNRAVAGAELHTNFKISNAGGFLALTAAGGTVVSAITYPAQFSDISYGSTMNGAAKFFLLPSPAALNTDGVTNVRPDPVFDIAGGTFSGSRTVAISTAMIGGTLRYTTTGARPQFDSAAYSAPLALTATAHLRAAMIFPGERFGASASASHLKLGADVAAFTSPLPVVILHSGGAGAVPGVNARGPNGDGSDVVEVALQGTSLTILDEVAGNTAMTSPVVEASRAGLRLRGSSSFTFNRKNYALETWTELNEEPREKSLLGMSAESDWVLYAPDPSQFDVPLIHNSLIYEIARQSGFDAPRFRFVEVFLNTGGGDITMADHRGLYLLVEKPKRSNGRVNFNRLSADGTAGGWMISVDRMDALPVGSAPGSLAPRHFHTAGPDGTVQTADDNPRGFQAIVNGIASGAGVLPANDDMPNFYHSFFNFESPRGWEITAAQRGPIQSFVRGFDTALYGANYTSPTLGYAPFIDVQNWAHHLALQSFAKNQDAVVLSAFLKRETPTAKMKWATIWDFDRSYNRNTSGGGGAANLALTWAHDRLFYPRLMSDPEFVQAYIDKWQEMRRGAFSTANMHAVVDAQVAEITSAVAARSGTTASAWTTNVTTLKTWLQDRGAAFDAQFAQPAVFSQDGGAVPAGFTLTMSAPAGTIYYTTNGTDPRATGGGIAGTAYTGAVPITATTTVFARVLNGSAWSGTTVATFYPPQDLQTLRVTELYYNPPGVGAVDGDEFEFLELQNTGLVTLDLGGLSFGGIGFTFPAGSTLAPGAYFLLARNPAQLAARFAGAIVNGTYTGKLDNNGETLSLVQGGAVVWSFNYGTNGAWPTQPDNGGASLQRPDPSAPGYDAATWAAAAPTPGTALSVADSDGDGMPDYFEIQHGITDASADTDGDGATNLAEFNAGTNPRNNASVFKLTASATTETGTIALEFSAVAARSYTVQYRDGLASGTWQKYYDVPAGPNTRSELITVPMNTVARFFRVITPAIAGTAFLLPASGGDNLALDPIFSDGMVLQRDMALPVWGTAASGHEITVTFNGAAASAVADANGRWLVELPAQAASKTSRELKVLAGGTPRLTVSDVLVGEVWLCAGQSNMEFRCDQEATWAAESASASLPHVRLRNMGYAGQGVGATAYSAAIVARQTAADFYNASTWAPCTAASAAPFSAVGYFFGKEIRNVLDVPVGLINMSVGGSPAESWMRRAIIPAALTAPGWITNNANLEPWCNGRATVQLGSNIGSAPGDDMGPNHSFKPAFLWNAGPARLAPFAIRGVLWYQGESNALSHIGEAGVTNPKWRVDQHETLFPLLVNDWRAQWGQGNFPFLVCQLSSISEANYDSDFWPEFRDYQRRATTLLPNMGFAVTSDIGNASNVHPTNKRDVGKRLARWAQRYTYGDTAALPCPLPTTATRAGSTVTVNFQHTGPALATSNAAAPATFELAGADGVFHPATASIVGQTITATSGNVPAPTKVRYAWQPFSAGNVVNSAGLPASTFSLNIQ